MFMDMLYVVSGNMADSLLLYAAPSRPCSPNWKEYGFAQRKCSRA